MPQEQIRFGLVPVLDAAQELPRTVLPLKCVRYHFVARAGLAEVEMTQVYRQENAQPLDCEYLFPLPADGAVYRCEAVINGRTIRAKVEEREAARKIVEEKKAEGRRTALVESERDNLFTLSLGNVQPQDLVEVTLCYLQPLRRQDGQVTLDLPLCPGVRYIPGRPLLRSNRGTGIVDDTDQVPDASRITPPRIDDEHPDAAFVQLDGQVEAAFVEGKVSSPSHSLDVTREDGLLQINLGRGGEVPDRDLALRWQERAPEQASLRGWTSQHDGHHYALLELRAPSSVETGDAMLQDVYFLVDRSGSMQGDKWRKAVEALHSCVEVLNKADRVWVTLFESSFRDFGSEPDTPGALLSDHRFRNLASIGTAGGTQMAPALRHVLGKVKEFSTDRPAVIVLITDAEIGNEREIVSLMRGHPELPVHCFGIDTTLNDSLLLDLVRQQGGTFHALQPREDVAARVTQLGRTLRQPVLVGLQLPEGWELAAGAVPNLYAGQIHLVSLRSANTPEAAAFTLTARDHRNQPATLEFQLTPVPENAPRLRWCKERLVSLVAQDDKAAAVALSRESNLICRYTAFVAWDDQEKVAVADHRLVQPAMMPEYAAMRVMAAGRMPARHAYCMAEVELFHACEMQLSEPKVKAANIPPMGFAIARKVVELADSGSLKKRIQELIKAVADMPRRRELESAFQALLVWLDKNYDSEVSDALGLVLYKWERQLAKWHQHCESLDRLGSRLADEFEQIAGLLRGFRHPSDGESSYSNLHTALAHVRSGAGHRDFEELLGEMEKLEASILARLEKFVRQ